MTSHKNNISKKWHLETYIISFLKYYKDPAKILDTNWKNFILKSHDHGSKSYYKFNKFLQNSLSSALGKWLLGIFFAKRAIAVRHYFLWVSYLPILGGVFVMCHVCKVPLFTNAVKDMAHQSAF